MGNLNFNNGLQTYTVNGTTQLSFNPTDINFCNSVFSLADQFEKIRDRNSEIEDSEDVYKALRDSDSEMRKAVDSVFGEGVSASLFGNSNVFSPCDGLPMVMNFLLAILDEIDASVESATNADNPRVNAYIRKYEKKYGKAMTK